MREKDRGLERALGLILFERTSTGYRITAAGTALLSDAERVESAALALERLAAEEARAAHGVVRLTTGDFLADLIAIPAIASLARTRPELRVELDISSETVDLAGGAADVALRAALAIDQPDLVARKVMDTRWAFYCGTGYAARHDAPVGMHEAVRHPLVMLAGAPGAMLRAAHPEADLRHTTNSMAALVAALTSDRGVGALPMLVGDRQRDLVRCFEVPFQTGGIWIVYHQRLRNAPQVRVLVDQLVRFTGAALASTGIEARPDNARTARAKQRDRSKAGRPVYD